MRSRVAITTKFRNAIRGGAFESEMRMSRETARGQITARKYVA